MLSLALTLTLSLVSTQVHASRDLVLEVRASQATIRLGEDVPLEMALTNRSRSSRHWVVAPGDGSEVGWREPYVWFTAQRQDARGAWVDVPGGRYGRCGLYDPDWEKDARELAPGERLPLGPWLPSLRHVFELAPGTWRFTLHYTFSGGRTKGHIPTRTTGVMAHVPAFELASAPVVVRILPAR